MTLPTTKPPYQQSVALVAQANDTHLERGLSRDEAQRRLAANGPNTLDPAATISWFTRLARQFTEPLVLLLLGALVISLVAWYLEDESDWPIDAIVIGVILTSNAGLGAFQERRADQAVQALADMTVGHTIVIRDAKPVQIAITDVVVGDLMTVTEGDVIAADARVITSRSLRIAESALTGESTPVAKQAEGLVQDAGIADRTCMLYSGTAAIAGNGTAIVTATGMDTEVGQIAHMLASTEQNPTPLEAEIEGVSRFLGIGVVAIAVVIAAVIAMKSTVESMRDVVDILIIAVSVAVAAVPEGLPAVLSLVLAIGVNKMARRNALVKRLASAETLGSATVICTDKTGTLTRNEMQVREVVVSAGCLGLPVNPDGGGNDPRVRMQVEASLLAAAVASNVKPNPAVGHEDQQEPSLVGDPLETALVRAAQDFGIAWGSFDDIERLDELPFDSDRRTMSVLVRGLSTNDDLPVTIVTKGAPEVLLDACTYEAGESGPSPLTPARKNHWRAETTRLADLAMRTLVVASRDVAHGVILDPSHVSDLTLLGLIGLMDPPRSEARAAIATAQRAGIRVIMLTGDHPHTAASIATTLGICEAGETAVAGSAIERADDVELAQLLGEHSVFARVAPAHKLRMVRTLQQAGHVVAMTGDGVNDAPALKAADIGTVMGKSGTGVAREAADMILTDDNFATIIEAVRGGRTIFNNVKRFLRYLLSSNVGEVLTIFLGVVFAGVIGLKGDGTEIIAPLSAVQILWINLLTDSGPAFALGVDPASPTIMDEPPRNPADRVIDPPMLRGIAIVGLTMALATLITFDAKRPGGLIEGNDDITTAQTAAFTVLVLAQLFNCFNARSDQESAARGWRDNPWLLIAVGVSLALQFAVVYVPFLQDGFGTTSLSLTDWIIATAVASSVLVVSELRKVVERLVRT